MKIFGKILDSSNEPLYLANITITTGSQINKFGTVANEDGDFSLDNDIISSNSQFKISYQGFKPQFYKASELQGRRIKMQDDVIDLDEIIIRTPKEKPKNNNYTEKKSNSFKIHLKKHKIAYAGLGGILGLGLILLTIKKLK